MKNSLLSHCVAALILIVFYSLYIRFHQHTCWNLIFPIMVTGIMAAPHYKYRIFKKRCLARCFLMKDTRPYRIMQGRLFSIIISISISMVYAVALMSFIALNSWAGLWYIILSLVLIRIAYVIIYPGAIRWISSDISHIASSKLISWFCFLIMIPIFLWAAFNTPIPDYVDHSSLSHTIADATVQTGSICPVTNIILKLSKKLDAIFYYYSVISSINIEQNWIKFIIWFSFFIKSSMVFLAMNRFNSDFIMMIAKHFDFNKHNNAK